MQPQCHVIDTPRTQGTRDALFVPAFSTFKCLRSFPRSRGVKGISSNSSVCLFCIVCEATPKKFAWFSEGKPNMEMCPAIPILHRCTVNADACFVLVPLGGDSRGLFAFLECTFSRRISWNKPVLSRYSVWSNTYYSNAQLQIVSLLDA